MTPAEGYAIEVARGNRTAELDEELVAFWTGQRALREPAARARLGHVVCVLRDPAGAIAAVNSVFEQAVPELGGCRFWVYRTLAPSAEAAQAFDEMFAAARERLEAGFAGRRGEPIGICLTVSDRRQMIERNEPVWPVSELMFAGYDDAGGQLRVVYFEGAKVI